MRNSFASFHFDLFIDPKSSIEICRIISGLSAAVLDRRDIFVFTKFFKNQKFSKFFKIFFSRNFKTYTFILLEIMVQWRYLQFFLLIFLGEVLLRFVLTPGKFELKWELEARPKFGRRPTKQVKLTSQSAFYIFELSKIDTLKRLIKNKCRKIWCKKFVQKNNIFSLKWCNILCKYYAIDAVFRPFFIWHFEL